MHIKNVIAVISDEALSPNRLTAQIEELTSDELLRHRQNLDRQWKRAQHADQLGVIHDADKAPRGACEYFLSRQRAATTLDQVQALGLFVGTVYV